jgi:hypothetical protein
MTFVIICAICSILFLVPLGFAVSSMINAAASKPIQWQKTDNSFDPNNLADLRNFEHPGSILYHVGSSSHHDN